MKICNRIARFVALGSASIVIVGLILVGTTPVAAAGLFDNPTQADLRLAAQVGAAQGMRDRLVRRAAPTVLRERVVRLNLAELARLVPLGKDAVVDREREAKQLDGTVRLDLFPNVGETFNRTDVTAAPDGGFVWEGSGRGASYDALLLIREGRIFGRVQLHDRLFKIEPVTGQLYRIIEHDERKFPPEAGHNEFRGSGAEGTQRVPPAEPEASEAIAKTVITILVAYTRAARDQAGSTANMEDEIRMAVALSNQAYKRGLLPIQLKLAGAPVLVGYQEGGNFGVNLEHLAVGSQFKSIRALRNTRKADLVALIRKSGNACGIADLPYDPGPDTADWAFSVTARDCILNTSFQHELGHNMGLHHDRYVVTPRPSTYNYGYVNLKERIRTVMAYRDACEDRGLECTKINWFSSSTIEAQPGDVTIGKAPGTPGAADNTRRLKETRAAISNYR